MKGQTDIVFIITLLLGLGFAIVLVFFIAGFLPSGTGWDDAVPRILNYAQGLDNAFLFLALGLLAAPVASAFFIRSHPLFAVFSIIGATVEVFLAWLFQQLFLEFASHSSMLAAANQAPNVVLVMQNLPLLAALFAGITFFVLVFKGAEAA
jgi:hypothetical protein